MPILCSDCRDNKLFRRVGVKDKKITAYVDPNQSRNQPTMIAETLAGIALVKSAVDGIKSAIGTANDIGGDIAGYIDNLFEGEKQVQQSATKKRVT